MSLVGRYSPVAYDPKASTTASGQMAVITPATRAVAAERVAASSSVGSRKRQNSTTSARQQRQPGDQYLGFIVGRLLSSVLWRWHDTVSGDRGSTPFRNRPCAHAVGLSARSLSQVVTCSNVSGRKGRQVQLIMVPWLNAANHHCGVAAAGCGCCATPLPTAAPLVPPLGRRSLRRHCHLQRPCRPLLRCAPRRPPGA